LESDNLKNLVSEVVREILARRSSGLKVALGSDHGGFELKERLKGFLGTLGYAVLDVGCPSKEAVDYPDLAKAVCRAVLDGSCAVGIMIDGAGIGSSMVCNKFRGIRAALCYDLKTILNSKQHNNANVLTLGAGANAPEVVEGMVKTWLETPFEGGRHQKRVDKIELDA
jgi:ribose 5-phosphate isomerase B